MLPVTAVTNRASRGCPTRRLVDFDPPRDARGRLNHWCSNCDTVPGRQAIEEVRFRTAQAQAGADPALEPAPRAHWRGHDVDVARD